MKERIIAIPGREVKLDLAAFPESARQDMLRVLYLEVLEDRKQPD